MKRREFAKIGLVASGGLLLPAACATNMKTNIHGGDEKLFIIYNDIPRIRGIIEPEDIRKMSKPMLIVRRKCRSTKFAVVHQLRGFDQEFKVTFVKGTIQIRTANFEDKILYDGEHLLLA